MALLPPFWTLWRDTASPFVVLLHARGVPLSSVDLDVILVLPSSSGIFLRRIPRVLWRLSRTFFALVMPWVFAATTSSRHRRRLMLPSTPSMGVSARWGFGAAGFHARHFCLRRRCPWRFRRRGASRRRLVRCRHLLSSLPSSIWLDCGSVIFSPRTSHFMDDEGGREGLLFLLFLSPLGRVPRDRINEFLFIHLHPIVDQEKILR